MSSISEKPPDQMRMSELKAELDSRNVEWRGTCFEKEELVARLVDARANPLPAPAPAPPSSAPPPAAPTPPSSSDGDESAIRAEVNAMRAGEIKRELGALIVL